MVEERAALRQTYRDIEIVEQPTAAVQPGGFNLLTQFDDLTGFTPGRHLWAFTVDGTRWLVDERDGDDGVMLKRPGSSASARCDTLRDAIEFVLSI